VPSNDPTKPPIRWETTEADQKAAADFAALTFRDPAIFVVEREGLTIKDPDFTSRVADSKPKRRQDDGRWSQDLLLQVRSFTGGTWADWATLTFSRQEGYGIVYNGNRPEMTYWVEGLCGKGVLHFLDEYVNGRAEQDCDQTDEQMGDDN